MTRSYPAALVAALLIAPMAALSLSGCGVVIGAGAVVGTAAAEERGLRGSATDFATRARVSKKFADEGLRMLTDIGVEVYEGRVLLTGATTDTALSDKAVALTWQTEGVKDVINEIQHVQTGVADFAHDAWITTQLVSKLTFDKDILSINYSVETVNRVVYLIGIAQSRAEVDKVVAHASNVEYVTKVVNHIHIKQPTAPAA